MPLTVPLPPDCSTLVTITPISSFLVHVSSVFTARVTAPSPAVTRASTGPLFISFSSLLQAASIVATVAIIKNFTFIISKDSFVYIIVYFLVGIHGIAPFRIPCLNLSGYFHSGTVQPYGIGVLASTCQFLVHIPDERCIVPVVQVELKGA